MTVGGAPRGRVVAAGVVVVVVLLLLVQVTVEAARHLACPADCSCLGNMVDCSKKRLRRIPEDLPPWVQIL